MKNHYWGNITSVLMGTVVAQGIPVIGEIPFSREAAGISARGELLFNSSTYFSRMFTRLYGKLIETAERTLNGSA